MVAALQGDAKSELARALKKYNIHLSLLEPESTGPPRRKPDAKEQYQYRITYTLLSDHTPKSLFELGMSKYHERHRWDSSSRCCSSGTCASAAWP